MIPTIPTRTDAFVRCPCGGTAGIATVAPIADDPGHMRHLYTCLDCGKELSFDVAKKGQGNDQGDRAGEGVTQGMSDG